MGCCRADRNISERNLPWSGDGSWRKEVKSQSEKFCLVLKSSGEVGLQFLSYQGLGLEENPGAKITN